MERFTGQLQQIAGFNDLAEVRRTLVDSAKELRACVARMSEETQKTVLRLRDEVSTYQTKLETVEELASRDPLTGLFNRRLIDTRLGQLVATGQPFCAVIIDLDGLKAINDSLGHAAGDEVLKQFGDELKANARPGDVVGRLGGDEFAIMVPGSSAVSELQDIARAMLDKLSRPFRIDERTVLVGASIGLASVSLSDFDAGELMRRADVAMYAAKRAGKMRLSWYDEMLDQKQAVAHTVEMELRAAIEAQDFDIVYQPVVGIHDKKIMAVEALLRWSNPTRGEVSPSEFIPVAEETGLIDRIGMIARRHPVPFWPMSTASTPSSSTAMMPISG